MTQLFPLYYNENSGVRSIKLQFLKLLKTGRPLTIYNLLGIEKTSQT